MRRLRKEEYLKKTENLDSARTWRLESRWGVVDSHSAAVCCCSRPMVGLFYKAVPVLADEDKIGGSAISYILSLRTSALYCRPPIGRSEQAKGNESKSAKYGLTAFLKDPITLHVRLCSFKPLSMNRSVRELMNRGLPWLPCHERFGPNMTRN